MMVAGYLRYNVGKFVPKVVDFMVLARMEEIIEQYQPALWVHGHIHHSWDYQIGRTRIIANPRGYVDGPNPAFDGAKVVELPVSNRHD